MHHDLPYRLLLTTLASFALCLSARGQDDPPPQDPPPGDPQFIIVCNPLVDRIVVQEGRAFNSPCNGSVTTTCYAPGTTINHQISFCTNEVRIYAEPLSRARLISAGSIFLTSNGRTVSGVQISLGTSFNFADTQATDALKDLGGLDTSGLLPSVGNSISLSGSIAGDLLGDLNCTGLYRLDVGGTVYGAVSDTSVGTSPGFFRVVAASTASTASFSAPSMFGVRTLTGTLAGSITATSGNIDEVWAGSNGTQTGADLNASVSANNGSIGLIRAARSIVGNRAIRARNGITRGIDALTGGINATITANANTGSGGVARLYSVGDTGFTGSLTASSVPPSANPAALPNDGIRVLGGPVTAIISISGAVNRETVLNGALRGSVTYGSLPAGTNSVSLGGLIKQNTADPATFRVNGQVATPVSTGTIRDGTTVAIGGNLNSTLTAAGIESGGILRIEGNLNGSVTVPSGGTLAGRLLVGGSMPLGVSISVPASGLAGQVVFNAGNGVTGNQWAGSVIVGGTELTPKPNYSALPITLGGSVGVVPFVFRPEASFPGPRTDSALPRLAVQQFGGNAYSLRLAFYGPLADPVPGTPPVQIIRFDPDGIVPDLDVTSLFSFDVSNSSGRRELFINPAPGVAPEAFVGPASSQYATRYYRVVSTGALRCDPAVLVPSTLQVAVAPFSHEFSLIYSCDSDDIPDPDQIAAMPDFDCYNANTLGQGSDGKLDKCQFSNPTQFRTNGVWVGCTRNAGSCASGFPADFSGDGAINVTDIFVYLSAWFGQRPCAAIAGDIPVVGDIFTFLQVWFAGCMECTRPPGRCPTPGC